MQVFIKQSPLKMLLRILLSIILCLCFNISNISCEEGSTLAFVIDDTYSMQDDIDQVKTEARAILDMVLTEKSGQIKDFVLVTVNDPQVKLRTTTNSTYEFRNELDKIRLHANATNTDCEEMSLTGIEEALRASRPGSYIYVFTDASAKDHEKVDVVKNLCEEKQIQVVFVLTGDCGHSSNRKYTVYYEVAGASGGQVFRVRKSQVNSVLRTISLFLKDKLSTIKWKIIPRTRTYVSVEFTIDEKIDYAVVSTSGRDVYLRVSTTNHLNGPSPKHEMKMWNDNGKVVTLYDLKPGTYYAWVKGTTAISLIIYARTDFTFEHGFSTLKPKSIKDTYKQPIADIRQYLSINVTDPDHSVAIKSVELLDFNNDDYLLMGPLPLRMIDTNFYITDAFVSPAKMFKIAVKGKIIKTFKTVTRISKTAIEPVFVPDTITNIEISEGDHLNVNFGSEASLTCKVSAHPAPEIQWFKSNGVLLPSESASLEDNLYISYLKLKNIKQNETFICKAMNRKGTKESRINIGVRPVFHTISNPAPSTIAKYKEDVKITCNIKSDLPITINWFWLGMHLNNSGVHSISADGSELTIKSMDVGIEGKYSCEASLDSDPSVKQTYHTNVKIDGLALPVIGTSNRNIILVKGTKIQLNCRTIQGYPKPEVQWFKKNGNHYDLLPNVTSDVLTVPVALLDHSGKYKCVAENIVGKDSAKFYVTINGKPEITITETKIISAHGSNVEFVCMVESQPPLTIEWKNEEGSILQNKITQISKYEFASKLKIQNVKADAVYTCVASNKLGNTSENVQLTLLSPFEIKDHINGTTDAHYGTETILLCDIRSPKPMKIQWYRETNGVESSKSMIDQTSNQFTTSSDGTELKIKSVDLDTIGKYTCEAYLLADPEEKVAFSTNVDVVDLIPPVIEAHNRKIHIMKGNKIELDCRITQGYPKPVLQWFKKNGSHYDLLPNVSSEVLTVPVALFNHSGKYKCVAENIVGKYSAKFYVTVNGMPEITIPETKIITAHGSNVEFVCMVESQPPLTIAWENEEGSVLENEITQISKFKFASQLKIQNVKADAVYTCVASNKLGNTSENVQLTLLSPFEIKEHINGTTDAQYGTEQILRCDIRSPKPLKIQWYRETIGVESSRSTIDQTSNQFTTSSDGTELKIKSVDLDTIGKYTCEAYLLADPEEKVAFSTNVDVVDLARPVIEAHNRHIHIMKGNKIVLNCRTVKGTPKPHVKWYKMNRDRFEILQNVSSEVLTVPVALFNHTGQYKCVAENVIDSDSAEFEVTMSSLPEITIDETKIVLPYDSNVELTCNVESLSPPTIEWMNENGYVIQKQDARFSEFEFSNQLKLQNVKKSGIYICVATNDLGSINKYVNVTVISPFEVKDHIKGETAEHFGTEKSLRCDIKSQKPMKIQWYLQPSGVNSKTLIIDRTSSEFAISSDGTELKIKSVNLDTIGKYTCEASLLGDPKEKVAFSTNVNTPDLTRPVIETSNRKIHVMKAKKIEVNCRTVEGIPKPNVKWFKKNGDHFELLQNVTSEVLTVPVALFTHAGQYKCVAENIIGSDSAEFEITVSSVPEITIDETKIVLPYDSNVELTCKVESQPPPTIEWTNDKGSVIQKQNTRNSAYVFSNELKLQNVKKSAVYFCVATNDLGSATEHVNITVISPFEVKEKINGKIEAHYGTEQTLRCDIKSSKLMKIQWYVQPSGVNSSKLAIDQTASKFIISSDGTELKINSVDVGSVGKYTCEAFLLADPEEKVAFSTDVDIIDLTAPLIETTNKKIHAIKRKKIELKCRIIKGTPKPHVKWFKKNSDRFELLQNATNEVLIVPEAYFTHTGQYKCVAENVKGSDSVEFDVTMSSLPETIIAESERTFPYGSNVEFTCNVESQHTPIIVWKSENGTILQNQVSQISEFKFSNKLKVQNLKKNAVFICVAGNKAGSITKHINVKVLPPFEVQKQNEDKITVPYGTEKILRCDIKFSLPMKIQWYLQNSGVKSSRLPIERTSSKHTISSDGTELNIKSVDLDTIGEYTCEASLLVDPKEKVSLSTNVDIIDLTPPAIEDSNRKIQVMKRNKVELNCRTTKGTPKPEVKWFKKNGDYFESLPKVTSEVLTIPAALFTHTEQYKCVAENVIGSDSAEFEVTMSSLPEITVDETNKILPYGSDIELSCKVESQPPPTIVWTNEKGAILQNEVVKISENEFVIKLKLENIKRNATYICVANNKIGSVEEYVNITVDSPFIVKEKINGEIGVYYGTEHTLHCDIKSSNPMKIQWYLQMSGVKSSKLPIKGTSSKFATSSDGTKLKINSMDLNTVGKYTCEASLLTDPEEKIAFSTNANVVGLIGPEVIYSTTVTNGKNFTAICRVKGVPKPRLSWLFKPKGSDKFVAISGSEEELNIPELKLNNAGVYRCVAKNNGGEIKRDFNVVVEEPPIIQNIRNTYRGIEGDLVVKIPCNVTGFPDPDIVWKERGRIIENDSKFEVNGSVLYIKSPKESDPNTFTCEAKNKLGIATKTFDIEVVGTFQNDENFYGNTHDIYSEQGKPVAIKCKIVNSETRSVRWYMNGLLTNQTGNEYIIEKASMLEEGNYTCRVNTNEGSTSENYLLDVGFPPTFDDESPPVKIVNWQIEYDVLDCTAQSKPEPKYEWYHDGKIVNSLNGVARKHITDWEEYTCKVSNVHGTIQKTFNVTTTGCYLTKNMGTQYKPLLTDESLPIWPFSLSNSDILLKEDQKIKISCPNDITSVNSFQMIPNINEIIAKCVTQDKFDVNGKIYKYSELQCKRQVEPSVINKHEQCVGPNSEMIRVGFAVNGFLDAYKICYDTKLNLPLYATVPLSLTSLGYGAELSKFKWSSAPEVGNGVPSGGYATCKISSKCCYTKEQLVHINETAFGPAQAAMFKENLNSVAVWNPCNSERTSWQEFMREIKDMPYNYESWSSWTGASHYNIKNGVPVPRYLWKVIKHDEDYSVMVYVNDESPTLSDVRCTKSCESIMASTDEFLYCCSLEDFSRAFSISVDKFQ